jgi:hypothetical protein
LPADAQGGRMRRGGPDGEGPHVTRAPRRSGRMASGASGGLLRLRLPLPLRRGRPRSRLGTRSRGPERLYGRALRVSYRAGDRRTPRLRRQAPGSPFDVFLSQDMAASMARQTRRGRMESRWENISSRRGARAALGDPHGRGPGWLHVRDEALARGNEGRGRLRSAACPTTGRTKTQTSSGRTPSTGRLMACPCCLE